MKTNNNDFASFVQMDLGSSKPTAVPMETVEVEVGADSLLGNYAKAFVAEAYRVNPLRAEQVKLTVDEVRKYAEYLLFKRVQSVHDECADFRRLKVLYIPSYIQYNLAMIGRVVLRHDGLTLLPVNSTLEPPMSFEEALKVSEKIGSFEDDLQVVHDGMPRSDEGDRDVMSTAMIAGYVRALKDVDHVSATYVTRFLGMKLREEASFATLYRVQYDDLAFIASALTTQKGIF